MKSRSQYESFEDRRKYPRLIMNLPVKVKNQQGRYIEAKLHDISPDGLQLRCNRKTAELIHPGGRQIVDDAQPSIGVGFNLTVNEQSREIIVRCSVCYFVLLEDNESDEAAFGLCYRQFKGESLRHIKEFFLSEMEPA